MAGPSDYHKFHPFIFPQATYWPTTSMTSGWEMQEEIVTPEITQLSIQMNPNSGILVGMKLACMICQR